MKILHLDLHVLEAKQQKPILWRSRKTHQERGDGDVPFLPCAAVGGKSFWGWKHTNQGSLLYGPQERARFGIWGSNLSKAVRSWVQRVGETGSRCVTEAFSQLGVEWKRARRTISHKIQSAYVFFKVGCSFQASHFNEMARTGLTIRS